MRGCDDLPKITLVSVSVSAVGQSIPLLLSLFGPLFALFYQGVSLSCPVSFQGFPVLALVDFWVSYTPGCDGPVSHWGSL